jgi:hypothetical protein
MTWYHRYEETEHRSRAHDWDHVAERPVGSDESSYQRRPLRQRPRLEESMNNSAISIGQRTFRFSEDLAASE